LPTPVRSSVFGVPLEELMGHDGEKGGIPRVLKDAIQEILSSGGCGGWFPMLLELRNTQDWKKKGCSGAHQIPYF